ncbi:MULTISPECIES: glycosyltransferase family 2 protein [Acinetobacter]|jgi:GT2 family glycosyltransferase|uniref:Gtr154 n=4 Tax=Acinetobacter baumannii TaxID=470 RepID=V5RB63_ACIBA|nr:MULTISPECIES: glycosyltransferase family 2 protein [Acinetobacter]AHB32312.1 Gtr154 [Acinetobacter baumannii]EIB7121673.1 glycosyltransferase family 2 protein [Acinetobacter baumannii]EJB8481243.1 glycosyltransferase family 2 protein [Acinetobacter baumannii]EKU3411948.1 glycosyltransferase family 2 protein [Acinetobacter baumannii]EXC07236.1 glycosyl transferase 2 family protein [Acinetobacter baumannii 625974]
MVLGCDVSIIIVNYNTYNLVLQCIESVIKNTKKISYEIIVVDNNSPNREIEKLNEIYPNVKLVLNTKNSGFGIANNIGNKYANGKFLFLLNSDTIVLDNSIYTLYKFMVENPCVGACGGNLCDIDLKPATSFTRFMPSILSDIDSLLFNGISRILYNKDSFYSTETSPFKISGNISGADLMLSKAVFDELGGFDENFFMYYEETDLLFRLRNKGYQTYIVPTSKIIHLEGASETFKPIKLDWTHQSKKKYYIKNKTRFEFMLSNIIFKLMVMQRLFIFKIINNEGKYSYWLSLYKWLRSKNM